MSSLEERDTLLRQCWRNSRFIVPEAHAAGPHFAIQVMGVVDDPHYRMIKGDERPFVDLVAYWPAARKWTITHCSRACADEATDYPVNVTFWQPLLPLPW